MKSNQEVKGFSKVVDKGSDVYKKYLNKKPSKEFIENIKSQSWYQVECVKCKISNRKWLEEKRNAHDYPISMKEIVNKKGLKIFYWCSKCKISWRG